MTVITFICILIIAGFFSGNVGLYLGIWASLPIACLLCSEIIDYLSTNKKWDYNKDNKENRKIGWSGLPEKKRIQIVERYKKERIDFINESLRNNIKEWRRNELLNELENIDSLYNLDTPPREWRYSSLS